MARQDPVYRMPEKNRDAEARRITRNDPVVRTPEKQRDANARSQTRKDPVRRLAEQFIDTERQFKRRKIDYSNYAFLLEKYYEKIKGAPSFICSCCGGLFYKESTSETSVEILKKKADDKFVQSVLYVCQQTHRLCGTCKKYVSQSPPKVPRLALSNGFDFPVVPVELQNLSPLEERLVALRIPFMQIRLLGSERQSVLHGNVVNVENNLDICAQVLPRKFDATSTVQVKLKRRKCYEGHYMYETIRPLKVYNAAKYFMTSELYKEEGVILSEDWSQFDEEEIMDFICPDDQPFPDCITDSVDKDHNGNLQDSDRSIPNVGDVCSHAEDIQNLGAEETLIFCEKDLIPITIAPGENQIPIPLCRDILAEVLSFPTIYCGMDRKFEQNLKVSYTDIAKSEFRRYDRRACNPTKVLYSFKKSFNEKVYQSMQVCLRKKVGGNRITAGNLKSPGYIENLISKDDGYAVFKNLRSSPSYWKEKTKKVLAIKRQVGKCSFFITLSAAETKWTELLIMLAKIVKNKDIDEDEATKLSFEAKADLIRSDPVTCMRHFDHRFRALINLLLKPEGGIFSPYTLEDYFSRMEFQMRGSPHAHGLYWIKDAPIYNENDENSILSCIEFIDKFITCERCEEGKMEILIGYQLHNHSRTCEKKLKRGEKCRFGYPKPPMKSTCILTPRPTDFSVRKRMKAKELFLKIQDELNEMGKKFKEDIPFEHFLDSLNINYSDYIDAVRSSIKRTTVFLKRKTSEIFVNAYNRQLLEAWGANMDIQFVLDTYACAKYCVSYILKSDGGMSKLLHAATVDVRNGNTSIPCKLKKFANILINGTEISAQEAAAFLLGIPNTICSRQDVFINTTLPDERIGFLKAKEDLDNLADDSEDVCAKGLLDHYTQRPKELEHICLAEFASMYEYSKQNRKKACVKDNYHEEFEEDDFNIDEGVSSKMAPTFSTKNKLKLLDSSGYVKQRYTRKIIRFRHYGKAMDSTNYHREQLMLFKPWRDEASELLAINSVQKAEKYKQEILENSKPFYFNREIDDEALINVMNEMESEDINQDQQDSISEPDLEPIDEYGDARLSADISKNESSVKQFLPPRIIEEKAYLEIMRSLNEKQRRFVINVLYHMKTSADPYYFFLSGGAGVGKSHVITAMVQSYLRYSAKLPSLSPDQICVLVSAPTGKAAFNVFGMTLHCTFHLPTNQLKGPMCDLKDTVINSLRVKLAKANLFIIDEILMVSVKQFYQINQRLQQIFDSKLPFGGKSVIVVGHLRQLAPIGGKYVFTPPTDLPRGEIVGNYLWDMFSLYELDEIMRQRGEMEFCKALNNMSEGCMDEDDVALMKSRQISPTNQPPMNAIKLFWSNAECLDFNNRLHESLQTEGAISTAFDKIQSNGTKEQKQYKANYAKTLKKQTECSGLRYQVRLQVGGEYFVSTNIDVMDGLFNGSTGTLKMIEFGKNSSEERVPRRAWMDFKNPLVGIKKRSITKAYQKKKNIKSEWVAIDLHKRNLGNVGPHKGLEIVRTQIPLVAANGMTIMKSQGSSLPQVCVNLKGAKLSRESLYVACSRATSRNGLYIDGEFKSPATPGADDLVTIEMKRMRSNPFQFAIKFLQDYDERFIKLYFHNVQYFVAHFLDVKADQNAMSSDILALVEPHLLKTDTFTLPNFNCVHRSNCQRIRNSKGALVFVRTGLPFQKNSLKIFKFVGPPGHCLFVKLYVCNVNLIVVYKSPTYSRSSITENVTKVLSTIRGNIVFTGDININLRENEGKSILSLMSNFNLKSIVKVDLATTDGGTHIDCCFTNIDSMEAWLYDSYYSYHKPICAIWPKNL